VKRAIFEEIKRSKSIEPKVIDAVMAKADQLKEAVAKESEYLPVPEID
jgi:hypothetical protein